MEIIPADLATILTTEGGKLALMFWFLHAQIKAFKRESKEAFTSIRNDVHKMATQINIIFVKLGKQDTLEKQLEKMEDRLHQLELHRNKCPMK